MRLIVNITKKAHCFLCEIFLLPIKLYRRYISPLKSTPTCRFNPTCSKYALTAVREWGIIVGTCLALFRIIRCNPFSRGGYDPVPERKATFMKIKAALKIKKAKSEENSASDEE